MQPSVLQKYGEARLPRYTSYPPSPEFSPAVGLEIYGEWLSRLPRDTPSSLYLHVPFCRSMCWYCGCHTTITAKDQPVVEYLDLLRREIDMVATQVRQPLRVEHVHFGGGTPTIVAPMISSRWSHCCASASPSIRRLRSRSRSIRAGSSPS